jgi:hypothetical protein
MKVKDLIQELSCFNPESEICIAHTAGDYWGTELANEVSRVETANVTYSNYHETNKIVDDDRLDNYDQEDLKKVVVIS